MLDHILHKNIRIALYALPNTQIKLIKNLISAIHSPQFEIECINDADKTTFKPGKQIIYLKKDSLVKLSDPIPVGPNGSAPYSLQYTMLNRIKTAKSTRDLRQDEMI